MRKNCQQKNGGLFLLSLFCLFFFLFLFILITLPNDCKKHCTRFSRSFLPISICIISIFVTPHVMFLYISPNRQIPTDFYFILMFLTLIIKVLHKNSTNAFHRPKSKTSVLHHRDTPNILFTDFIVAYPYEVVKIFRGFISYTLNQLLRSFLCKRKSIP